MDNSPYLLVELNDSQGISTPPGDLPGVPGLGADARTPGGDPTLMPLVVAVVVVTAAISGYWLGYALGPAAFMVVR